MAIRLNTSSSAKTKKTTGASRTTRSVSNVVSSGLSSLIGGISSTRRTGNHRRSKGPAYWTNKVIVEKLKRKYQKLKYGSVR